MLSYTYVVIYTAASLLSLAIMYLFTIYYVNLAQAVRINCYVGYASVIQNNNHLCRYWNIPFFQDNACARALLEVSYGKCGSNAFASVGENFVEYANLVDTYIAIESGTILIALAALWLQFCRCMKMSKNVVFEDFLGVFFWIFEEEEHTAPPAGSLAAK
jgi:hypothetical protein